MSRAPSAEHLRHLRPRFARAATVVDSCFETDADRAAFLGRDPDAVPGSRG
jgi:hypothetical protein